MTNQNDISLNSCKFSICIFRQVCRRATAYGSSETYSGIMQRLLASVLQKMNPDAKTAAEGHKGHRSLTQTENFSLFIVINIREVMTAFCIPLGNTHESEEKPCQLKGTKSEPSSNYFGLESRNQSRTNPKANCFKKD